MHLFLSCISDVASNTQSFHHQTSNTEMFRIQVMTLVPLSKALQNYS